MSKKPGNTTQVSQAAAAAHVGKRTPPAGGSEVLQADEYIKGLLLRTVQSFSGCVDAACPVSLVLSFLWSKVSHGILRPWTAQRPQ